MAKFPLRGFTIAIAVVTLAVFLAAQGNTLRTQNIKPISTFWDDITQGKIEKVRAHNNLLRVTPYDDQDQPYTTRLTVPLSTREIQTLANEDVHVEVARGGINWNTLLIAMAPILLLIAFLWFFMRHFRSSGDNTMQFGRSRAKLITEEDTHLLFKDVAGCDEAKQELAEVVAFLRHPHRFHALGARTPKGVLMVGPPGSGKTHLAKAVAGEAQVPFLSLSGSDFVEMFVGVGAARVRDLFETAKKSAPCIIFIDEIDAVGRKRGGGSSGGNDEREQTLNALLVEMDGFNTQDDIIIIAATNRPDVLDPALLRPGRFDRQIAVDAPDVRGREAILRIHAKDKPLATNVNLSHIARRTPGFVGADLENLLNESALIAARQSQNKIYPSHLDEALDRVLMGLERRSRIIPPFERNIIAHHETGHALAAYVLEHADTLHKITIIPRGKSMGHVSTMPQHDQSLLTRQQILDRIALALAGRAAEDIVFGDTTTGASHDYQQATRLARAMITKWGMSEKVGMVALAGSDGGYLGEMDLGPSYSSATAKLIDEETQAIIQEQYTRVKAMLVEHQHLFEQVVDALLERETLSADEFDKLMHGESLPPLPRPSGSLHKTHTPEVRHPTPSPHLMPKPQ